MINSFKTNHILTKTNIFYAIGSRWFPRWGRERTLFFAISLCIYLAIVRSHGVRAQRWRRERNARSADDANATQEDSHTRMRGDPCRRLA